MTMNEQEARNGETAGSIHNCFKMLSNGRKKLDVEVDVGSRVVFCLPACLLACLLEIERLTYI